MKPIADILAEIPELAEEAAATRGTRPVSDDGARSRSVPSSRVLADLDRMLALSGANDSDGLGVLSTWVRCIIDEMDEAGEPEQVWPADTVTAVCTWLSRHMRWCSGRGFESELHGDLRRLHGSLRHICRRGDAKPWPCLTSGCQGSMRLADGMLECDNGHVHDGLRRWRYHPSMTVTDVAEALNVPARTVRYWRGRGMIATDEARSDRARRMWFVWPWDVIRVRYPDMAEAVEGDQTRGGAA